MAKRPRRSKKRRRRRRRRKRTEAAVIADAAQPASPRQRSRRSHSQQRRRGSICLKFARFWLIAASLTALVHTATAWPGRIILELLEVAGAMLGLLSLGLGIIRRHLVLSITGITCLCTLLLIGTIAKHGTDWLDHGEDWAALAVALACWIASGTVHFLDNIANRRPTQALRSALAKLASELEGDYRPEYPRVELVDNSRRIFVYPQLIDRRAKTMFLELIAPWPDREFRLELHPAGRFDRFKDLIGMEDIPIGHMQFDSDYVISTNHPYRCARLIQPNVRDQVNAFREREKEFCLAVTGCQFVFKVAVAMQQEPVLRVTREILGLYRDLIELQRQSEPAAADTAKPVRAKPDVVILDLNFEPTCQICGSTIEGEHAECRKCRTPHHIECWDYLGGCSTYACSNDTYRRRKAFRKK